MSNSKETLILGWYLLNVPLSFYIMEKTIDFPSLVKEFIYLKQTNKQIFQPYIVQIFFRVFGFFFFLMLFLSVFQTILKPNKQKMAVIWLEDRLPYFLNCTLMSCCCCLVPKSCLTLLRIHHNNCDVYLDSNKTKQIKQKTSFWQHSRCAREIFTQQKYTGKLLSTSNIILH